MKPTANSDELLEALKQAGKLERYDVGQQIGTGAQGCVYEARIRGDSRPHALKIGVLAEGDSSEAEILDILGGSRNLVKLEEDFEVTLESGERAFGLVLEWADRSLDDLLREHRLGSGVAGAVDPRVFFKLARSILVGLEELHTNGYLHCDLKPANIGVFIEEESVAFRLLDLGSIAVASNAVPKVTDRTRQYCAPERLGDSSASKLSDIYEAGATLLVALGWEPDGKRRAHQALDDTLHRLEKEEVWEGARVDRLKIFLEQLLRADPVERSDLKVARRELEHWHDVAQLSSKLATADDTLRQALKMEREEKNRWKVLAAFVAVALMGVAALVAHDLLSGSPWVIGHPEISEDSSNQVADVRPLPQPPRLQDAFLEFGTKANGLDGVFAVIPGAVAADSFAILPADGSPKIARELEYREDIPISWREIPADLHAGEYWLVCDGEADWKGDVSIPSRVTGIEFLSGRYREDGTPRIIAGRAVVLRVGGRNLPRGLTVLLGQQIARPYEEIDAEGNPVSAFRNSPTAMSFTITAPHDLRMEGVDVYVTQNDYAQGHDPAWTGVVDIYSPNFDDLKALAEETPDYYGLESNIGKPELGPIVDLFRSRIEELADRCTKLVEERLSLDAKLVTELAMNLEHWQAVVHRSRSLRSLFRSRTSLSDRYSEQLERLEEFLLAWKALDAAAGDGQSSMQIQEQIDSIEQLSDFVRMMLEKSLPVRPFMSSISISLKSVVKRDNLLTALDLDTDSDEAERIEELKDHLESGWIYFDLGIEVTDSDGVEKVYRHNGDEETILRVQCSAEVNGDRLVLELDDGLIPSDWPRWQLGDRVVVGIIVGWDEPGFGIGPASLSDRVGEAWLDPLKFAPQDCHPPGYTYEILLTTWRSKPWVPEFDDAADSLRQRFRLPAKAMGELLGPSPR